MTLVVNLFGGPGIGKSTFAADLFSRLKRRNIPTELVTEAAKKRIWEGRSHSLRNQIALLGEQWEAIEILCDQVDAVIVDAPVMLAPVYAAPEFPPALTQLARWCHDRNPSLNILLTRVPGGFEGGHQAHGRVHGFEESLVIDRRIETLLNAQGIPFTRSGTTLADVELIADLAFMKASDLVPV